MLRSGLTERIRRGARCSYLEGTILAGAQDIRVHSTTKTTKEPDVRRRGLRHITQIYATILTIAPRDLISRKRIYLAQTATAHSFTVGRPRTTPLSPTSNF